MGYEKVACLICKHVFMACEGTTLCPKCDQIRRKDMINDMKIKEYADTISREYKELYEDSKKTGKRPYFYDLGKEKNDPVNHPAHYKKGEIEYFDAIKSAIIGLTGIDAAATANAIKYLWRWRQKDGVQDLQKAIWYIEKMIVENSK